MTEASPTLRPLAPPVPLRRGRATPVPDGYASIIAIAARFRPLLAQIDPGRYQLRSVIDFLDSDPAGKMFGPAAESHARNALLYLGHHPHFDIVSVLPPESISVLDSRVLGKVTTGEPMTLRGLQRRCQWRADDAGFPSGITAWLLRGCLARLLESGDLASPPGCGSDPVTTFVRYSQPAESPAVAAEPSAGAPGDPGAAAGL